MMEARIPRVHEPDLSLTETRLLLELLGIARSHVEWRERMPSEGLYAPRAHEGYEARLCQVCKHPFIIANGRNDWTCGRHQL